NVRDHQIHRVCAMEFQSLIPILCHDDRVPCRPKCLRQNLSYLGFVIDDQNSCHMGGNSFDEPWRSVREAGRFHRQGSLQPSMLFARDKELPRRYRERKIEPQLL
ncbi:MAG: hypothetical protein QOF48_2350, partial [Verrucomicrobiota bacterium]